MGGFVCASHRRKNKGFPTLKRTLNLGIEKGRLLKNSRPKGGLIQVVCYPTSQETVDIRDFLKSSVSPFVPRRSKVRFAPTSFFAFGTKRRRARRSPCSSSPQKVSFAPAAPLQARSPRLRCTTNFLRTRARAFPLVGKFCGALPRLACRWTSFMVPSPYPLPCSHFAKEDSLPAWEGDGFI